MMVSVRLRGEWQVECDDVNLPLRFQGMREFNISVND